MKILYLECNMGASGDMIASALFDLLDEKDSFMQKINSVGLPKTRIHFNQIKTCGIGAYRTDVIIDGVSENEHMYDNHSHSALADITEIIHGLNISDNVKRNAEKVYRLIAQAEGCVHHSDIDEIHFHEVGSLDAVADVVMCQMLLEELDADKIICSEVNVGSGFVRCAHGILPVPAPAAAILLKGVPIYNDGTKGELCTPTGAALLKHCADDYGAMPVMRVKKIGYGAGSKEFDKANVLRAFLGDADEKTEEVIELSFNVDDMTAEDLSFACELLSANGAIDVTQSSVYMKKSRAGVRVDVLCSSNKKDEIISLIFKNTSTIGVREYKLTRHIMHRSVSVEDTCFGKIRVKVSRGYGVKKKKWEYDDIKNTALKENISVNEVKDRLDCSRQK